MIQKLINEKKRQRKIKTTKNIATGAATGILAGLAAGILFAPKAGKETREDIVSGAKDINEKVKTKAAETKTTATNKAQEAKEKISKYLSEKRGCSCCEENTVAEECTQGECTCEDKEEVKEN